MFVALCRLPRFVSPSRQLGFGHGTTANESAPRIAPQQTAVPCGSVSAMRTLLCLWDSSTAMAVTSVDLPTPPFRATTERIGMAGAYLGVVLVSRRLDVLTSRCHGVVTSGCLGTMVSL